MRFDEFSKRCNAILIKVLTVHFQLKDQKLTQQNRSNISMKLHFAGFTAVPEQSFFPYGLWCALRQILSRSTCESLSAQNGAVQFPLQRTRKIKTDPLTCLLCGLGQYRTIFFSNHLLSICRSWFKLLMRPTMKGKERYRKRRKSGAVNLTSSCQSLIGPFP